MKSKAMKLKEPSISNVIGLMLFTLIVFFPASTFAQVSLKLGDLAEGESIVLKYRVRANASNVVPDGVGQVSVQGTVAADELGDVLTDNPDQPGASDPNVTVLVKIDSDGDGLGDDLDQCPTDAAKTEAGACGCFQVEADTNKNGVSDCSINPDLKEEIRTAKSLVKRLKPDSRLSNAKKRKAQGKNKRNLKKDRTSIRKIVKSSKDLILTTGDNVNLSKLEKSVRKTVGKALKTSSSDFPKSKKQATRALKKLDKAVQ